MKKYIKISKNDFIKIISHLKKLEIKENGFQISRIPLSDHLLNISDYESNEIENVDFEVKAAILMEKGLENVDPNKLKNDYEMAKFGFSDLQDLDLRFEFELIAKKRNKNSNVLLEEYRKCKLVGNCILLVLNSIKNG